MIEIFTRDLYKEGMKYDLFTPRLSEIINLTYQCVNDCNRYINSHIETNDIRIKNRN